MYKAKTINLLSLVSIKKCKSTAKREEDGIHYQLQPIDVPELNCQLDQICALNRMTKLTDTTTLHQTKETFWKSRAHLSLPSVWEDGGVTQFHFSPQSLHDWYGRCHFGLHNKRHIHPHITTTHRSNRLSLVLSYKYYV